MRLGYLMIGVLFAIIGVAVVRTYQLSSASAQAAAPTPLAASPLPIARVTTPTRFAPVQTQPTSVPPTPVRPTPAPATSEPTNGAPPTGAQVKWVDIPSAANKVGIRQFDIITVFDKVPVDRNHFLADLIASKRPGDVVQLTVVRGDQTLELSTQLRGSPQDNNIAYLGVRYAQQGSAPPEIK